MQLIADLADRLLLGLNRFVCAFLLTVMATLVFGDVVGRHVLGVSASWAEEASCYLMLWRALLAAGLALREGAHIAVELLPDALPPRAALLLRGLVGAIVTAFLALLLRLGLKYAEFARMQRNPVLGVSMGVVYLAVPVVPGFRCCIFCSCCRTLCCAFPA